MHSLDETQFFVFNSKINSPNVLKTRAKKIVKMTKRVFQSWLSVTVQTPKKRKITDSDELASIFIAYLSVVADVSVMFSST